VGHLVLEEKYQVIHLFLVQ